MENRSGFCCCSWLLATIIGPRSVFGILMAVQITSRRQRQPEMILTLQVKMFLVAGLIDAVVPDQCRYRHDVSSRQPSSWLGSVHRFFPT